MRSLIKSTFFFFIKGFVGVFHIDEYIGPVCIIKRYKEIPRWKNYHGKARSRRSTRILPTVATINLKMWFSSFLARKNINANPTGVHKSKTMFESRMYCMSLSPDKCELWVEELEQCLQLIQSQNVGNHTSDEAPSLLDHRWDCIPNVFQEPDTLTLDTGH